MMRSTRYLGLEAGWKICLPGLDCNELRRFCSWQSLSFSWNREKSFFPVLRTNLAPQYVKEANMKDLYVAGICPALVCFLRIHFQPFPFWLNRLPNSKSVRLTMTCPGVCSFSYLPPEPQLVFWGYFSCFVCLLGMWYGEAPSVCGGRCLTHQSQGVIPVLQRTFSRWSECRRSLTVNPASDQSSQHCQHLPMLFLCIVLINYNDIPAKTH